MATTFQNIQITLCAGLECFPARNFFVKLKGVQTFPCVGEAAKQAPIVSLMLTLTWWEGAQCELFLIEKLTKFTDLTIFPYNIKITICIKRLSKKWYWTINREPHYLIKIYLGSQVGWLIFEGFPLFSDQKQRSDCKNRK